MTRGQTRVTSRWWCLDCKACSPGWGLTMTAAGREAQKHTNETRHATCTSTRPIGSIPRYDNPRVPPPK